MRNRKLIWYAFLFPLLSCPLLVASSGQVVRYVSVSIRISHGVKRVITLTVMLPRRIVKLGNPDEKVKLFDLKQKTIVQ